VRLSEVSGQRPRRPTLQPSRFSSATSAGCETMATWLDGISIVVALACELQRDWAREETVADVIEIVLSERLLKT
jgi:hypothetical protein